MQQFILKYLWHVLEAPFLHKHTTIITPRKLDLITTLSNIDGTCTSPPHVCFSWFVCLCAETSQGTYVAFSCHVSLVSLV